MAYGGFCAGLNNAGVWSKFLQADDLLAVLAWRQTPAVCVTPECINLDNADSKQHSMLEESKKKKTFLRFLQA